MAITSRLPNGEPVTNGDEQLSDCVIASGNRFADFRPFCDDKYLSNKTKWSCILPWEFPQIATQDSEEAFLRRFFTQAEIRMQGFRFLKQAWYSLALRNLHHGIPTIAETWMHENAALLEDPAMRGHLCEPEVTPETFFRSHEIQRHTRKLLELVIPVIQAQVKIKYEQPAEMTSSTESQHLTTDSTLVSDSSVRKVRPTALAMPVSVVYPAAATSRTLPITPATVPTDPYSGSLSTYQGTKHRQFRDFTPGYSQHTLQVNGRKRDGQNGSNSFNRPLVNGRRQSDNFHQLNPKAHRGAFSSSTSSFCTSAPGPMTATSSGTAVSLYGAPPGQLYHAQGFQTSQPQTLGPYYPPGGPISQEMLNSTAFHSTPRQQFSQPRHLSNHSDNERFPNNKARNTSFNEVSNTSGDARRTSFGSRGGGLRGQYRTGRGRGGRARDSFGHSSEEPPINQATSDYYSKSGSSHGKRHNSAYQGNTWRSSSEHPQVENAQPQRVFSGPDQYPSFQDFQGPAGIRLLPPFISPHGSAVTHQGPPTLQRPLQTDMTHNPPTLPDLEIGTNYIGADAVHVNELVVFNIPVEAMESEVAKAFAHACDVDVDNVEFTVSRAGLPYGVADKMATVRFRNHQVARRVLDLREVNLYGRPLRIEVPHRFILDHRPDSRKPYILTHRNQGLYALPHHDINLWLEEPANSSVQPPQHGVQMGANASFGQSGESIYASYQPSRPFHSAKGGQTLSVVQSVNATPVNSGPNTPKKPQSKNTKKSKKNKNNKTPLASGVEGESVVALETPTVLETPVKPTKQKRQERQRHPSLAGNDLPVAPRQVPPLDSSAASKDTNELKRPQSPEKSIGNDDNAAAASSRPLHETSLEPQSQELEKDRSQKSPIASLDALATDPTHPQVCPSEVGSDITPKASPRSQLPVRQSIESSPNPDQAAMPSWSEKQSVPPQSSPPLNGSIRPASVIRTLSDSDHVDESFHTASASPPDDKQTQPKNVTSHSEQPASLAKLTSAKPRPDSPISPVSLKNGRSMAPVTPKISPKAGISVSIQKPTPLKSKARSGSNSKDDKSQTSAPKHDVGDALDVPKSVLAIQQSDESCDEQPVTSTTIVSQPVLPSHPSPEQTFKRIYVSDSRSEEKVADATKQRTTSSSSVPPTSAATDPNSRKTSVPPQVSAPSHSSGSSTSKPKAAAKKGPSQTESLSMFGKKQQKQKKPAKGKGTLKGKPLDSGSTSGLSDGISSRDLSSVATSSSTVIESTTGKGAESLDSSIRHDSRANAGSTSDESKSAVSRQVSPGKGGILGSLGGLGRVGNFFSMASSPSVSGHEKMPQDAMPDGALTYSKAPVAVAPITSSIGIDLIDNASTASDLGRKHNFGMPSDTYNGGFSTSTLGSSNIRGARDKKREKKKKQQKQDIEQKGGEGELVSSDAVSGALEDTMSESHDVDSDNRSDESSTTMGRPTPPVSPKKLSESKRKRVENRVANTEQHIITPPAPRNQHIKRKSYSRSSSSTTGLSKQEATPPTPTQATSETVTEQHNSILQLLRFANSDDEDGSQQSRPRVLIVSRSGESEGNSSFTLTDSGGFKFTPFVQGGDDESDQVTLNPEQLEQLRSAEAPVGRILEEVDSEDESSK
jgi:hypothetical protein